VRSLRTEYGKNVVTFCPKERCADGAELTTEEAIEFEALEALPLLMIAVILRRWT
jgi:hypothetical protein